MKSQGSFRLKPIGPYSFDLSYSFYRRSKFEMVDRFADRFFMRPIAIDGIPILIKIPYGNDGLTSILNIKWQSPGEFDDVKRLRLMLARMFYVDFDIENFYRHPLDKAMRGLTRRFTGFRPILTPDVFEASAWAIIGQQVNLQFAYRLKSRIVEYVNRSFTIDGIKYYLFPSSSEVADMKYKTLRSMQFSGRKAEYLLEFARMVSNGELDLEDLAELDYEPAQEKLLSIRGIGPWSANYILMRGAGHRDAFPIGDSGINHAVRNLYGLDKKPDIDLLLELGERWRPYRSLATFYLWKSL
jgi:DNA-3-methyladenine glycosylase II